MIRGSDDCGVQAFVVGVDVIQHLHNTHGGAAAQSRASKGQATNVVGVKTVYILVG